MIRALLQTGTAGKSTRMALVIGAGVARRRMAASSAHRAKATPTSPIALPMRSAMG